MLRIQSKLKDLTDIERKIQLSEGYDLKAMREAKTTAENHILYAWILKKGFKNGKSFNGQRRNKKGNPASGTYAYD